MVLNLDSTRALTNRLDGMGETQARIQELVNDRLDDRIDQNHNMADAIRVDLSREYGIDIDDK